MLSSFANEPLYRRAPKTLSFENYVNEPNRNILFIETYRRMNLKAYSSCLRVGFMGVFCRSVYLHTTNFVFHLAISRAAIIYCSQFINTKLLARLVAEGLYESALASNRLEDSSLLHETHFSSFRSQCTPSS